MNYWGLGLSTLGWLVLIWSGGHAAQTHTGPDYAVEVAALQAQLLALAEDYAADTVTVEAQVRQVFMAFEASALDRALAVGKPTLYKQMEQRLLGLRDLAQQKIPHDVFQREVQAVVSLLNQGGACAHPAPSATDDAAASADDHPTRGV